MRDLPTITLWKGRPLEDLSKTELIDAVKALGWEAQQAREHHRNTLEIWKLSRR